MSRIDEGNQVIVESEKKTKVPKQFKVILLNDDYTSMEFVIYILQKVFHKPPTEAFSLMMAIHQTGSGVGGVYSFEIAEMKTAIVMELAREHEYPLRCIMEEE